MPPQLLHAFDSPFPLIRRCNHFLVPDIFADNQQRIFPVQVIGEVEISLHPINMKMPHRSIEIRNPQRAANR